jgi:2-polyprenyl-3-methyl-5-hydroxy-6-metoxy-1,4-benzoquinol methylase
MNGESQVIENRVVSSTDARMNVTAAKTDLRGLRALIAIASFGEKNIEFLKQIIHGYQAMTLDADLIVFSDKPKNLGDKVKVIVGLPAANPWSLPFAHKACFAENLERYDLFIYSEDDIGVTEENIRAFLRLTPQLEPDKIAGYLRYEVDQSGGLSFPDIHGAFHWRPESVRRLGDCIIAEFTNEHAGFYILTQPQLRQIILSGGYLVPPFHGKYGLPETAATDPYTSCGFRKVICISAWNDFIIHHLPNRYVGQTGIPLSSFKEQIQTLMDICANRHPATSLCKGEAEPLHCKWAKSYYETPGDELLRAVSDDAKTILSIGCGWGGTENRLKRRGAEVTALPLDSVIGAAAARLGIEVIYGTLEECLTNLEGRRFDCVLISNLLHLQPNPMEILQRCSLFVREGGTLVVSNPNFGRIPVMLRRALGIGDYKKLQSFSIGGINPYGMNFMKRQLMRLGFRTVAVQWYDRIPSRNFVAVRRCLGRFMAGDWILKARRQPVSPN